MKKIILLVAGLAMVLMAGPIMAEKSGETGLNRAVIKIDTLSCGGCFSPINAVLADLDGYSGMGANLFRKLIAVDFKAPLTAEKISEKLVEVGYPGKLEDVDAVSEKESFAYRQSRQSAYRSGGGCCSVGSSPQVKKTPIPSGGSCCTSPPLDKTKKPNQPTEDL